MQKNPNNSKAKVSNMTRAGNGDMAKKVKIKQCE